ncbi:PDZ and LIM domain protein 5-like, partial [Oncorhynchus nerka]|uniref:PDZ and LIM domain protein 5-like n=1 Tax=Oncorhynchus nerka TaxID=8023 RepID=UPI0031B846D5
AFHAVGDQKDSLAPASVQPKYSFAPSTAINKMARPFTPGGGNTVIKPVTYAPKVNTPASAPPASMLQPHNGGLSSSGLSSSRLSSSGLSSSRLSSSHLSSSGLSSSGLSSSRLSSSRLSSSRLSSSRLSSSLNLSSSSLSSSRLSSSSLSSSRLSSSRLSSSRLSSSRLSSSRLSSSRLSSVMNEKDDQAFYDHQIYQHEKHGLRVDGIPMFIPNDRSKKRLIEDTQDWQPHTGTTQSRSFRMLAQLTGTDYMQDPDDETMKRAREKFLTEIQSPRYARLRDWHHERSARALNIKS